MQAIIMELAQLWSNKKYVTLICFFSQDLKKNLADLLYMCYWHQVNDVACRDPGAIN